MKNIITTANAFSEFFLSNEGFLTIFSINLFFNQNMSRNVEKPAIAG
jgi:hypothetical protein